MKNHSKIGKRDGKPSYRTPSQFIARLDRRQAGQAKKVIRHFDLAARMEHHNNRKKLK